ncbi:MAG: PqqD family protein [Nitrososphaerota archaeon]|nr:PqqD family protein [Candidatus Calditenuaceae archaeon]MDW8073572.1 PqqD family protein [Nitrososphaerota archaeon]
MAEERRFNKSGYLTQTGEGELLLVNEKGVAYLVNESIVAIWDRFEEKTVEEVIQEVADISELNPDELREPIRELVDALVKAELLV